jgi:hypothetical protein
VLLGEETEREKGAASRVWTRSQVRVGRSSGRVLGHAVLSPLPSHLVRFCSDVSEHCGNCPEANLCSRPLSEGLVQQMYAGGGRSTRGSCDAFSLMLLTFTWCQKAERTWTTRAWPV